jgi:hypothetical protein
MRFLTLFIISSLMATGLSAQCASWIGSPNMDEAENAHVIYRPYVKNKDFKGALEHWQLAYDLAPAADGKRDDHFRDGIAIYRDFLLNATEEDKKTEYKAKIMELYETGAECIANGAITYKNCTDQKCRDERLGIFKGRQGVDMYYYINPPRAESFEVFKEAIRLAGNASSYTILKPCTDIIVSMYLRKTITEETARNYMKYLADIIDHNVATNPKYAKYYEYEESLMNVEIAKIEKMIYDCSYFVDKMMPKYEENPTDPENLKVIIVTLKRQGCVAGDPFLDKVEAEYGEIAKSVNDSLQQIFEAAHPEFTAKACYDEGDWNCAIAKYKEAIEMEEDPETKASYHFSIASIQYRKKNEFNRARTSALKAANLRKGWGRPYMLIGDMYAKSSRTCGDDAYTRGLAVLAAIDKWSYAKKVDSSVAEEANRNIAKFNKYIPPKDDAFMQSKKEGDMEKVGCWIGETVRLRVK